MDIFVWCNYPRESIVAYIVTKHDSCMSLTRVKSLNSWLDSMAGYIWEDLFAAFAFPSSHWFFLPSILVDHSYLWAGYEAG